jgi:hypothetical protein
MTAWIKDSGIARMGITELTIATWPWLVTMLIFLAMVHSGTVALAPARAGDVVSVSAPQGLLSGKLEKQCFLFRKAALDERTIPDAQIRRQQPFVSFDVRLVDEYH